MLSSLLFISIWMFRPSVADIQVPLDVFEYIDSGRNPQLYTKDCMEKAHSKNGEVKGKIDAYR